MCSRFFHVFAESSSPSLARFSLREVGLISTLYVFGDAFWLPICKSGSSQSYNMDQLQVGISKPFGSTLVSKMSFEGWIFSKYFAILLCMSTTFSWIICLGWLGPTLLKMDANSEKKRNHMVRTFLTSPSRLLIISWEDFNSYEWNLLSQIKRLWMMKGRS